MAASDIFPAAYALVLGILSWALWSNWQRYAKGSHQLPYPPGPPPLPIVGNVLDLPTEREWLTYYQWSQQYGDVTHAKAFGQSIIILNSLKAVRDLLERRSAIYSDRPRSIMINELMGFGFALSTRRYGEAWRVRRRAFHAHVHPAVAHRYFGAQRRETLVFLDKLLARPEDIAPLCRELLGATILKVIYGIQTKGKEDRYIVAADEALRLLSVATLPGAYLVDFFSPLRYVPSWFPGAGFQKVAKKCLGLLTEMLETPLNTVKEAMAAETAVPCVATRMFEAGDREEIVKDVCGIAYAAGADTTVSSVLTFFLAMTMHHSTVQARARAELDAVVGSNRLPDFEDRDSLPYLNAIVSECLRCQPVTPLAVPHAVTEDDAYNGMYIPKGSIVIGNAWAILHDPEAYPDPEEFKPERFLKIHEDGSYEYDHSVLDPRVAAFGFGRRQCPGRHVAEHSIFAVAAMFIATFTITPALDECGASVPVAFDMTSGILSHPKPWKCAIRPRSEKTVQLLREALAAES